MSERGDGTPEEKAARIKELKTQLEVIFLSLCAAYREMGEQMKNFTIVYTEYMEQTND